ncbi:hypothetical protein [Corynebacterium accolens]|uniref:hypothetical protein n=1 Tax=Corynebacterium accolens TaxID=38284 RepID=UPI00266F89FE|nr:hypothetical protein [Corynebacterium accolens]WKS54916.1 hypothetical protein NLL31_06705 [Corynebacterium accolens]
MTIDYVDKYNMLSINDLRDAMDLDTELGYTPERYYPADLNSLKRRDRARDRYYFSDSTMHFFKSRVNTILRTGVFVEGITDFCGDRRYKIGWITPCGAVIQLSDHMFATMRTADKVAAAFSKAIEGAGLLPPQYMRACN